MKSLKPMLVTLLSIFILAGSALAQGHDNDGPMHGRKQGHKMMGQRMAPGMNIPGLTDKQKTEMKKIHLAQMDATKEIRNQIMEKKAHLRTLQTADKANIKAINATIDEISALKTQMAKKQAAMHQKIRSLLTPEQRTMFDNRPMGKKGGDRHGRGMKKGCPNCNRR